MSRGWKSKVWLEGSMIPPHPAAQPVALAGFCRLHHQHHQCSAFYNMPPIPVYSKMCSILQPPLAMNSSVNNDCVQIHHRLHCVKVCDVFKVLKSIGKSVRLSILCKISKSLPLSMAEKNLRNLTKFCEDHNGLDTTEYNTWDTTVNPFSEATMVWLWQSAVPFNTACTYIGKKGSKSSRYEQ